MSKKILFILLFSGLAFVGWQINFSPLLGTENQFFTLFQFFGPIAGAFLGPLFGAASVLLAEVINFALIGKEITAINLFRLSPMLLAAVYFGAKNRRAIALIPLACMAAFWLHPVGSQVWYYALFWLIPLATTLTHRLFPKSLGATFTAHAIGSTLFLYTIPTSPALWVGLPAITAIERGLFAVGISISYIVFNTLLARFPTKAVLVDPKYVISKLSLRA